MSRATSVLLLALAALLETGGDAAIRIALGTNSTVPRVGLFTLGAGVLFAYGYLVNRPPWSFGQLLGLYMVFFFVIAQLMSWLVFHQRPSSSLIVGGMLIVAGGVAIALGQG